MSADPRGLCALAIMTKAPRPGKVKTRLTPPLTPQEAAALNICFLRDISSGMSGISGALGVAVYTPAGAEAAYENVLPQDFLLFPQRGNDFGERLIFAAEDLFKAGFDSVCLINSDSPAIPAENFAQAVESLRVPGDLVVLGPCRDGGYYLIGLKILHRELFQEIDWSTERVLRQTRQRAADLGIEVKQLPMGDDIDDRAALRRLCNELFDKNSAAAIAPNTRNFLSEIIAREGRERIWPA